MLYFAHKPDLVFTAILHTALESEGESLKGFVNNDPDLWEACYPESSRYFEAAACVDVLTQVFCASRDPIVYCPTDYHWLLLYEVLQNFCVIHNDLAPTAPKGWRPVGEFKLSEIDFNALVDIYFWDTDFLIASMRGSYRQPDELPLVPIEPTLWVGHRPDSNLFNPVSLRYPHCEET
ncbi:MAG TPA: hypothetical protein VGJ57_04180 [Nitrospirales bacterium]